MFPGSSNVRSPAPFESYESCQYDNFSTLDLSLVQKQAESFEATLQQQPEDATALEVSR